MKRIALPKFSPSISIAIYILVLWSVYFITPYIINTISTKDRTFSFFENVPETLPPPSFDDHYKWKSTSPYTIVSYFSMDCKHCQLADAFENKQKEKYQKAFTLIYRNLPIASQPLSFGKAIIAECVYDLSGEERMFKFISDAYTHYDSFASNNEPTKKIAEKYVQDTEELKKCTDSISVEAKIQDDVSKALLYGVKGTITLGIFKNNILLARFDQVSEGTSRKIMDYLSTSTEQ